MRDSRNFLFHPSPRKPLPNATLVILSDFSPKYGFSDSVVDNGVFFPGLVKPGFFGFRPEFEKKVTVLEEEEIKSMESSLDDGNAIVDLDFLIKGFELGHRDATSLFFLAGVLSAAYAYVVGGPFARELQVISSHILGRFGYRAQEAFGFYLYEMSFLLRMKFMPFTNLAPWVKEHEWDSAGFIVNWFLIDLMVGLVFSVGYWAAVVDSRRGGREIVKEGYRILLALFCLALEIRLSEAIICGSAGRWMLKRIFGEVLTMIFQSLVEVYFMVAWLIFYFSARQRDHASVGRAFGRRELEGLLDVAR
ncbi:hypothetical protein OROGR_024109 [Orobanche gracilis]